MYENQNDRNLDEIFQINMVNHNHHHQLQPQHSSSTDIDNGITHDKNTLLRQPKNECHFIRSHSLDLNSMHNSTASRGNVRRWSQSLVKGVKNIKNGRQTVREKTINFMPSRLQAALLVDGQVLLTRDKEIEQLTKEIEQHDHLMEDNAIAERLRIETLRTLPKSLTSKREIKAKISRSIANKSNTQTLTKISRFKYKILMWLSKCIQSMRNTMNNIEIWYGSMKKIEGHFGSGVSTYFKFLRWHFCVNLLLLCASIAFIIFPQILYTYFGENNVFVGTRQSNNETTFHFIDLFTGNGYLSNSMLFYGAYTNTTFSLLTHTYNLPYAYFLTMICLYMVTFIAISLSMASSYRKSFIETSGGVENLYAHNIFCSWDFGISNKKAAQLKHTSILNELKELLYDGCNIKTDESTFTKFWVASVQVTAHLLVFGMIAGLGIALWILLQVLANTETDKLPLSTLYLPLTINLIILIFQTVFSWIAKMEDYKSDRLALHISLMRNYVLGIVVIGVLIFFWLTNRLNECWETLLGQEMYRLIIMDFLIFGLGNSLILGLRFMIFKWIYPQISLPEFNISRDSLGVIFNQILLLIGLFYSPPLAIIVVVKTVLTFYIKKFTLIYFCKPPSKLFRSAQTSTLFLVMTFLSTLGVVVCHAYIITRVKVSRQCGPFSSYEFMYQIFIEGILALKEGHWFWRVVMFFTKPAFIGGILLTMCVIVYYLRSKSKARIAMVRLLKDMLYMEAKDKEFLLGSITKITKDNEWIYDDDVMKSSQNCSADYLFAESSRTWNFRNKILNQLESEESSTSSINTTDSLRRRF